jgi:outer membrane protein OmpA-like peptidoglycan-associated protein
VKYYAGERYENLYGNVGVRYMFGSGKAAQKRKEAKGFVEEAKTNVLDAEKKADEALIISKEAIAKEEEGKKKEKEMKSIEGKEEAYKEKIKAATKAIEKAKEAIKEADEAEKKGQEAREKVEAARALEGKADKEGYAISKREKEDRELINAIAERAIEKARIAKANAEKAKEESQSLLIRVEGERRKNEELARHREDAKINREISDEELAKKKVEAEARRKRNMIRTFTLTANFKTGSYFLTDEFKAQIKGITEELKNLEYKHITIEGHTDSTGSKELNKKLSRQRARSVYDEFVKAGVEKEKMSYVGFGSTMPIQSNQTITGRTANRRTEIFIE